MDYYTTLVDALAPAATAEYEYRVEIFILFALTVYYGNKDHFVRVLIELFVN